MSALNWFRSHIDYRRRVLRARLADAIIDLVLPDLRACLWGQMMDAANEAVRRASVPLRRESWRAANTSRNDESTRASIHEKWQPGGGKDDGLWGDDTDAED